MAVLPDCSSCRDKNPMESEVILKYESRIMSAGNCMNYMEEQYVQYSEQSHIVSLHLKSPINCLH